MGQFHGETKGRKSSTTIPIAILAFLFGCIVSTTIVLNFFIYSPPPNSIRDDQDALLIFGAVAAENRRVEAERPDSKIEHKAAKVRSSSSSTSSKSPFDGIKILVAIVSFDFSQIPHLEEVLDAYQDLCMTGASKVDIVIHTTVAYPVTLIDLLNSRLLPVCRDIFSITIIVKPSSLRLHLVDCHREMFYQKIDDYDLFIYTEDDIRVTPRIVGAYLTETKNVQAMVGTERSSDFNVGIVRYEYNYPNNVVMDDKTRHATQNVTRVYWEHSSYPIFPKAMEKIPIPELSESYVQMSNHHQGMFLATRFLLNAWKERPNCNFNVASNRPGMKNNPGQPLMGTQRVWMSSQMLGSKKYCNVQQVLPVGSFGSLTVLHLPNKNYRRVGHYRNRTFSDGTEVFDHNLASGLLTAMTLHLEMRRVMKQKPTMPYKGIRMVDEVGKRGRDRSPLLERRMGEYQAYVDRGGRMSEEDMDKTALV